MTEFTQESGRPGTMIPTRTALRIWMLIRSHGAHHWGNIAAEMPNRNAGPQLLQKQSSRRASRFDKTPLRCASAIHCAPVGYPPNRPVMKIYSAPFGSRQSRPKGRNSRSLHPATDADSRLDRKKNGNRDGINVPIHRMIPSNAPCRAVLLSRIKASSPVQATRADAISACLFMSTTSEEPMQNPLRSFIDCGKGGV